MKIITAFLLTISIFPLAAQEKKSDPLKRTCIIVKMYQRKGADTWGRWTVAKPYNFVEGDFPPKMKYRWELNGKDVEKIKKANGNVVILKSEYTLEELKDAREQCKKFVEGKESP